MELQSIPALAGRYVTTARPVNLYYFADDMQSGHTAAVPAGEEYLLDGRAWTEGGQLVWLGIRGDEHLYFAAADAEALLTDEGGSLGSFLGFLDLPFTPPGGADTAASLNRLLMWLLLGGAAIYVINRITE